MIDSSLCLLRTNIANSFCRLVLLYINTNSSGHLFIPAASQGLISAGIEQLTIYRTTQCLQNFNQLYFRLILGPKTTKFVFVWMTGRDYKTCQL